VAEHVVDAGDPGQQQLGALQHGPGHGHLPAQVAADRGHDLGQPLQQGQLLAHARDQPLREVGVGVDQPGQHHPVVVADHLGAGEAGPDLGGRAGRQHLAAGEGDRAVLEVAGRPHGQQVPGTNHNDLVHQRLLESGGG
jgi:hypothetical protein